MALKLKVLTKFPAIVQADTGLAVERENGEYTFSLDLGSLSAADTIEDDTKTYISIVTPAEVEGDPDVHEIVSVQKFLTETSAVNDSRQIISGAGLTGGGDLSADRTLAVGAGTGITVNADDVALDTSHVRNVDHSAVSITAGAGLTGGGTLEATRTLDVGAGTGIAVNANDVALAAMAAYTIKGNATGSSATPTDIDIAALTTKASPAVGDYLLISDQAASGQLKKATVSSVSTAGSVSSFNGQTGAIVAYFPPQGRVTLATGTPVMGTSYAAQTTVYYTPYVGDMVPLYNGTNIVPTVFTELSQATTDTTKSPAAVTTNSNYDIFVWSDGGTLRATRGPAWSSSTSRGTGAGTTELVRVKGLWLNANAITNGPSAQRGTYVGTIRSNGSSQIDYIFGAVAASGTAGSFGVWNAYNRVPVRTFVGDTTDTWTYGVASTWRSANGSSTMRVSAVRGLDEDPIDATYHAHGVCGAATIIAAGVGLDSTTAFSGTTGYGQQTAATNPITARYSGLMGLGFHFVSALEYNTSATASTWVGDLGAAYIQTGLHVELAQ